MTLYFSLFIYIYVCVVQGTLFAILVNADRQGRQTNRLGGTSAYNNTPAREGCKCD